ncbi:hypothetical protein EDD11_005116 [Mortierella claussenii]|nr:hypothetical protein EDD11_005116 [Mortierella claussenii]
MNQIDQSLDDIIKTERQGKKMLKKGLNAAHDVASKQKKSAGAGIQTKGAPIRTEKGAKSAAKAKSPYARPGPVKKETALFTESYKAAKAPVTQIFTAGYIPKPATTLKLFTTNYNKSAMRDQNASATAEGPLTTKPLRLVTTQASRRGNVPTQSAQPAASTQRLTLTTHNDRYNNNSSSSNINNSNDRYNDERIPTGPRNSGPVSSASSGGSRGGDFYRPNERNERNDRSDRGDRNDRNINRNERNGPNNSRNSGNDRRGDNYNDSRGPVGNSSYQQSSRGNNNSNQSNSNNSHSSYSSQRRGSSPRASEQRTYNDGHSSRPQQQQHSTSRVSEPVKSETLMDMDMDMDMDMGDGIVSIKGSAPNSNVVFRGESGPVTIEIENLDPGTTADDVKYVCSRFGEIKSCICTNGFSQVTYARKAAGLAAIENLNGKKADNGKILRVTMRRNAIVHEEAGTPASHVPSPIAGPMKILTKAVHGTITNAGTLYSDQLLAAQHMLKVQQHRMAQLHREEQRISSLRMQTDPQLSNLNSLSSSGVNRGFF